MGETKENNVYHNACDAASHLPAMLLMRSKERTTRACETESTGVFLTNSVNNKRYLGGRCIGMIATSSTERALQGEGVESPSVPFAFDVAAAAVAAKSAECLALRSNELLDEVNFFVRL